MITYRKTAAQELYVSFGDVPWKIIMTMKEQNAAQTKPRKFKYFIGIDVSKNKLDYAVMRGKELLFHRVAGNEPEEILKFIGELTGLPGFNLAKAVFCMENTGMYCNYLIKTLKELNANIHLGHALHMKNSFGLIRGKYDKIDAIRIATYAWKNRDDLRLLGEKRFVIRQLQSLNTLRNRLIGVSVAMKTPLKEQSGFVEGEIHAQIADLCEKTGAAIKADLIELNAAINAVINSDARVKRLNQIVTSVPGVGPVTALQLLISTNEFKNFTNPKKFACYAGVAPFKKESGTGTGVFRARVSRVANRRMKSLLHTCALRALPVDENLRLFYERKTVGEKKPKMSVLNAIRFKLILRIFACVNQDRCYSDNYDSKYAIDKKAADDFALPEEPLLI